MPRSELGPAWPLRWLGATAVVLVVTGCGAPHSPHGAAKPAARRASAGPSQASPSPTPEEDEEGLASPVPVNTAGLHAAPVATAARSACRSDPLANVYHPSRLDVLAACTTVSGTVESVRHEDDGDVHFDLGLDAPYRSMLDAENDSEQHGWLVIEIVPADEPGCVKGEPPRPASGSYDYGICTGADEQTPGVGEHVWVTGPYVIDTFHGWAEIHPAWQIATSAPALVAPPAPAPAPSTAAPAATTAAPAAALACSASMSNPTPSQYSTTTAVVHTAGGAAVSATAHYKTTDTTNSGTADSSGVADIPFRISRATKGYTVVVDVTVTLSGRSASCSTSFTPQ